VNPRLKFREETPNEGQWRQRRHEENLLLTVLRRNKKIFALQKEIDTKRGRSLGAGAGLIARRRKLF
jgi:hypothetical protein